MDKLKRIKVILSFGVFVVALVSLVLFSTASVNARIYTTDADFDEGILVGVEHETVHDQLQLTQVPITLSYIWVPNKYCTVSKVNTETGDELGRYRVAAPYAYEDCSPSRTAVDLQGNCWVGNRQAGTVVKIGLYEAGQCVDRNGDGIIQTSQDLNIDGDITSLEILPWGQDECVLYEVVLIPGHEATYVPGTYTGPYDYDSKGTAPRGLGIDASNNLWAGTWSSMKYYYIDGSTGDILKTVDVAPLGHHAYGAVIDANGILWSSGRDYNHILRLDPSTDPATISRLEMGHWVYGLGLDYLGHLFVSGWNWRRLSRVDISTGAIDWTQYKRELDLARGVVCTSDNDVWVASTAHNKVYRYNNDGNLKAAIHAPEPTGLAVDAVGKVWACNLSGGTINRIDPATNKVDLSKRIIGSLGHYCYSDMTHNILRTITTKTGSWSVVYDSEIADAPWGTISWTSDEPEGTSIIVRSRSSNDGINWSAWEVTTNGIPLTATPDGRYIEIEATLQITAGEVSPILYDLTVSVTDQQLPVFIDIKPRFCPNPFNVKSRGVLPVSILGTEEFDISTIDPSSIRLSREGVQGEVAPVWRRTVWWRYKDVATPFEGELCDCHKLSRDGYIDLLMKFKTVALVEALDLKAVIGETIKLTLTGNLKEEFGGIPIIGQDCIKVIGPKRYKVSICHVPSGNINKARTISVGPSAVDAHLAHGDTLGPCRH